MSGDKDEKAYGWDAVKQKMEKFWEPLAAKGFDYNKYSKKMKETNEKEGAKGMNTMNTLKGFMAKNPEVAKEVAAIRDKRYEEGAKNTLKEFMAEYPEVEKEVAAKGMKTLKEFMAENPEVAKEIAAIGDKRYEEGVAAGAARAAELERRVAAVIPYLKKESAYAGNKVIGNLAIEVLAGEKPQSTLEAVVAVLDSTAAGEVIESARQKTQEIGETPPQQQQTAQPVSPDGSIASEDDFQAAIKRVKNC